MIKKIIKRNHFIAILFIAQFIFSISCYGQKTWFKYLAPLTASQSFYQNDTIITLGILSGKNGNYYNTISYSDKDGNLIRVDSIKSLKFDSLSTGANYAPREKYFSTVKSASNFRFGMIYNVKTDFGVKQHSAILSYPNLDTIVKLDFDTFNTQLRYYDRINGVEYAAVKWSKKVDKLSSTSNFLVYKIENNIPKIILNKPSDGVCAICHQYPLSIIKSDKTSANLLSGYYDEWNYRGTPANWQYHIIKMDTSGKVLWDSRITANDTFNTTGVVYFQGSKGNIFCVWTNLYYGPHMDPTRDYYLQNPNRQSSIWLAEIDINTGKVLWRKSIYDLYKWHKLFSASTSDLTLFLDVSVSDSMAVFMGKRYAALNNKPNMKIYPIVMAIDFNGNYRWYREFDFYPNDTGDNGFNPYSIISMDSGYLLTGEYFTAGGQASNGISFQKGAILKLDKDGCFTQDCDKFDNVIKPTVLERNLKMYPNPAVDFLTIESPDIEPETQVCIYDQCLKLVKKGYLTEKRIDVSDLKSGVYNVVLDLKSQRYYNGLLIINH
jgi:hypothetical protein